MSIVGAPFLWMVTAAAVLTTGATAVRRRSGWARAVVLPAGAALALAVGVDRLCRWWNPLGYRWPISFAVWMALPLFAVVVGVQGWRASPASYKAVAAVAPVMGFLFAVTQINAHYAYARTITALVGQRGVRDYAGRHEFAKVQTQLTPPTRGSVISVDIPGLRSGFRGRNADVYLPPAWFRSDHPRLPVIMLLHGTPGGPADWTRSGQADVVADQFAALRDGVAPVMVFPDVNGGAFKDTECVDGPRGQAETYLVDDVRTFVNDNYNTESSRQGWMVGGFSEGGTCAITLALRHPEAFAGFLDFAGDARPNVASSRPALVALFGGDVQAMAQHDPAALLARMRGDSTAAWFEVGSHDRGPLDAARQLAAASQADGAPTCLVVRGGGHNFDFWRSSLRDALPWAAGVEGLTEPQGCAGGPVPASPVNHHRTCLDRTAEARTWAPPSTSTASCSASPCVTASTLTDAKSCPRLRYHDTPSRRASSNRL